jgi:hypothetical protein
MLRLGSRSPSSSFISIVPDHLLIVYGSIRRYSLSKFRSSRDDGMNHGKKIQRMMMSSTATITKRATMKTIPRTTTSIMPRRYYETNNTGSDDDIQKHILQYAKLPQTPVSLQTLLQTGRGEFLHKSKWVDVSNKDSNNDPIRGATGEILIQVRETLFLLYFGCLVFLYIRPCKLCFWMCVIIALPSPLFFVSIPPKQ